MAAGGHPRGTRWRDVDHGVAARRAVLLVGLVGCALPERSAAQTAQTAQMAVSATVQATCAIGATGIAFGIYAKAQVGGTAALTITCSNTTSYYINLGDGLSSDGSWYPRMTGPSGALMSYRLYQDAAYTVEWRNTYNLDGRAGTGTGSAQNLTVYGRILAGQTSVVPGAYADTVVATVTF